MPILSRCARLSLVFAGVSGAVGVLAGAWASHAGGAALDAGALRLVEIGARYQLVHAVALLGCAVLVAGWPGRLAAIACVLFCVGTILFSGSLYVLAATGLSGLGGVTPLGGICFVAGWLALAAHAITIAR